MIAYQQPVSFEIAYIFNIIVSVVNIRFIIKKHIIHKVNVIITTSSAPWHQISLFLYSTFNSLNSFVCSIFCIALWSRSIRLLSWRVEVKKFTVLFFKFKTFPFSGQNQCHTQWSRGECSRTLSVFKTYNVFI